MQPRIYMRILLLRGCLEKLLYPAALLGLGLLGNKYIVKAEVKEEIKEVKENVATLTTIYSSMESSMATLVGRQDVLEDHYKTAYSRVVKGCQAKAEEK